MMNLVFKTELRMVVCRQAMVGGRTGPIMTRVRRDGMVAAIGS